MSIATQLYNHVPLILANGSFVFTTDPLYLALLGSSYTFSAEHTVWADIAAYEVSITGYTAGGFALANQTLVRAAGVIRCDADDLTPSGLTGPVRHGVIYANIERNGLVKPLVKYILWDNTPADLVLSGGVLPAYWSADGLIKMVVG